ncbi:cationic amino acid transporter 8, vacuolar-like [Arachis stenosperma]|uniref:cationic amino acid transporter 8, vacuolar-like n=1 Tax=Arachis stenosperma TaxID=217475 RepID=UPI0025AD298F|nr:cationic amino acid transporter 8, vacuolar-like [Arachis stenosperma]
MEEPPPPPTSANPNARTWSYWQWSNQDFFPEPSLQSFTTYRASLASPCFRLRDRLLNHSSDNNELNVLPHASENPMCRCLTAWVLTWLAFGSGIFVIISQEAHTNVVPAIVLAYAISGFSALLSALWYIEFAVDVPVVGGSFSFLRIELGDFIAFLAAGNILLEAVVGAAGLGRSWSSYFASMIKNDPNFFRIRVNSFQEGFNMLDPIAVVIFLSPTVLQ